MDESERGEWDTNKNEDNWGAVAAAEKPAEASESPRTTQTVIMPQRPLVSPAPAPQVYQSQTGQQAIAVVRNAALTQPLSMGERDKLLQLMYSEEGFIGRYVRYFTPITQVPVEFHIASAITAVSAAVGNRVSLEAWQRRAFPNIDVLEIAGSGVMHKTYSISLMLDILRLAAPKAILPSDFSSESLLDILAEQPSGLLAYSEFSELLQKMSGRDYMAGVKKLLTDLFDNPTKREFKYRGRQGTIENPAPTILGATNLAWLEGSSNERDIVAGFLTRFLVWTGQDSGPPVPSKTSPNQQERDRLVDDLKLISQAEGEADFSTLRVFIDEVIQRYEASVTANGFDPTLEGMYARIGIYTFKLSVIFMLSRTLGVKLDTAGNVVGTDLQIIDEDILRAAATLRYCHSQMESLPFAFTPAGQMLRKVENFITKHPQGIKRGDILRGVRDLNETGFESLVSTLLAKGFVETQRRAGGRDQFIYFPPPP